MSQFKRMSYNDSDRSKWGKVFVSSFISSDESDIEDDTPVFIVKELPWRSSKVSNFFTKLDDAHHERLSEQASRQKKPRLHRGRVSTRPLPAGLPSWASQKT